MEPASKKQIEALKEEIIREFCASSSIHGVRYLDSAERTTCERFWWIIVFCLSLAGCGAMIYKEYIDRNQNPIIVSFADKTTPLKEVQFPAFTICPTAKASVQKLNFTAEINGLNDKKNHDPVTIDQLKAIALVCPRLIDQIESLEEMTDNREPNIVNTLKNISRDHNTVFKVCQYAGQRCFPYMKKTVTESGLCYSFDILSEDKMFRKDILHNKHRYIENWPNSPKGVQQVPLRVVATGIVGNLKMVLTTEEFDIDHYCTWNMQGYQITVHESSEYPSIYRRSLFIPLGHEVQIALKPQIMTTSPSAKRYASDQRQCFLDNERHLQYFKTYNQANCELECLTNVTLQICGCVRFSMPRNFSMQECSLEDRECMDLAYIMFTNSSTSYFSEHDGDEYSHRYNLYQQRVQNSTSDIVTNCNCLPSCSTIQYDIEVTQNAFSNTTERSNRITMNFQDSHFITMQRTELHGTIDFIADCGGLLGLFMGFSILSLLEICYFITIRPFSLRKKWRKESIFEKPKEDKNITPSVMAKDGEKYSAD